MIEKVSNLPTWRIGDTVYTFDQLENLYNDIGQELFAIGVDTGDYKPPGHYNRDAYIFSRLDGVLDET